ncbi:hypothetical protein [Paraliomyxa miuraensis]|uniref:hypothetical protein n=1 Tax=Paraliomyxa miuraensis TaxID=376150 RepID=UPI00224CE8D0|nr:hypothetical protein [Paraliomyxa miuraensis]MCX4247910.1 hypothetical protein [Paraliomyxa miuraensis]
MNLTLPPPETAHDTLRAMATVALADGAMHAQERRMIELLAEAMDIPVDVDALLPIEPDELAAKLEDPEARKAFVQRIVILSTLDGEITEDEVRTIEAFTAALDVDERAVDNIRQLSQGYARLVAFDLGRRSFMPKLIKGVWRERGVRGLWQIVRVLAGRTDPKQVAEFERLGTLPEGTLGRAVFQHFTENGFAYPGQKYGAPKAFMFHDIGHVLGGYGTTPDQELLVAGFQAGYMDTDGLVMYLMIAMLFQLAIEPVAKMRGVEPVKGALDIERFLAAVQRGRAMTVSLVDWDPWPHMERPLDEVRAELGLRAA